MSDTATIYPIPRTILEEEGRFWQDYSWGGLTEIEVLNDRSLWRDEDADVSVFYLMDLGVRSDLVCESNRHREAYRAGVFIGTVLLRHRIRLLGAAGLKVESPTESATPIDWSAMRASRFLLSPLIEGDGEFDPKPILYQLESAWDERTTGLTNLPADDWVTVGVGDILALHADRFTHSRGLIKAVPLAPELKIAAL